jgi:hypothetical protein
MKILMANYEAQREAFESLLRIDSRRRILLIHGGSGTGKTTLLRHYREQVGERASLVPMDLKRGRVVSVPEIFSRIGYATGWERFPRFTQRLAELEGPDVKITKNWLGGINNSINAVLRVENSADRDERRTELTNAWFNDVATFDNPMAIVFDNYHDSATEVQDWIRGPFLARAAGTYPVRVIVAGQFVPDENNIEWGHCCESYILSGVIETRHWMPLIQAERRRTPHPGDPETWLAGVCHALAGNPKQIRQVIDNLPREG